MLQRGHNGDVCVLASTLCKYDLRKGDLFVLSWARVRRVRRGSISSELLVFVHVKIIMNHFMDLRFILTIMILSFHYKQYLLVWHRDQCYIINYYI